MADGKQDLEISVRAVVVPSVMRINMVSLRALDHKNVREVLSAAGFKPGDTVEVRLIHRPERTASG